MRRLIVILALIALIFFLHVQFPYALQDEETRMRALYFIMLLMVMGGGRRIFRNKTTPKVVRDALIWLGVVAALVLAYGFRDELGRSRLMAELVPSHIRIAGDGAMSVRASEYGHFFVEGEINGSPARFLIDTGASDIVLTQDDARRAGIDTDALDYSRLYSTANGTGRGAGITLGTLQVGSITLDHVPASVNKTWMHESLLGMSFLSRLKSFRVEGNTLVLVP